MKFDTEKQERRRDHTTLRIQKFAFSVNLTVHTDTIELRFQIFPLWRPFSKVCVFSEFDRPHGYDRVAFSNLSTALEAVFSKFDASFSSYPCR